MRLLALEIGVIVFGLSACSQPHPIGEDIDQPPMQNAVLTIEAGERTLRVSMAGAWVDEDGDGHGRDVVAEVSGAPPLVVSGTKSRWRLRDGVMVFEGSVEAQRADVTMFCDRLEVTYDGENVQTASATGGTPMPSRRGCGLR